MSVGNQMYPKGIEKIALKQVSWTVDPWRIILLDNSYAYNEAHEFISDVVASEVSGTGYTGGFGGSGRHEITARFQSIDVDGTLFNFGASVIWIGLSVGDIYSFVVAKEVTSDADSPLLLYEDQGFPQHTTGSRFPILWGPRGVFLEHSP